MNDIPLKEWDSLDSMLKAICYTLAKELGEGWSNSTTVCIAKAAARILKEREV